MANSVTRVGNSLMYSKIPKFTSSGLQIDVAFMKKFEPYFRTFTPSQREKILRVMKTDPDRALKILFRGKQDAFK